MTEEGLLKQKMLPPFDDQLIEFVNLFSRQLLDTNATREFPELNAAGFWMRKANILKMKNQFFSQQHLRLSRGIVFHIAPSNVDTIFLYSWVISFLCGNLNILRISSKSTPQTELLLELLNATSEKFHDLSQRFLMVRYEYSDEVSGHFSSLCDMRVIWGGDETIRKIRTLELPPTAKEIVFADKFSMAAIKADVFNLSDNKMSLLKQFFNDVFWFNQMACSSPRLLFWVGNSETIAKAQAYFWAILEELAIEQGLEIDPSAIMDKFISLSSIAIEHADAHVPYGSTNRINRIQLDHTLPIPRTLHCGAGLFYEMSIPHINEIASKIVKKDQTITSFGFSSSELRIFLTSNQPLGVDRIVPIGDALNFSSFWDGYDLFSEYTRYVEIKV
jgi:hypothetical protein